ncbi:virulence factor TspB C-terminal domain-related protein [Vibrio mimicus]|uniref:virulence factor TspB C-terminal domain-related protein n=1 Tax=Vibrio mimicus TaxID=674 RepID=UPI002F9467DD
MRIYTRIVIKLFFAFCFLFSASSFSSIVSPVVHPYVCQDVGNSKVLKIATSNNAEECKSVASSASLAFNCKSPLYPMRDGRFIFCQGEYKNFTLIQLAFNISSCPDSHPVDNGDGTCSDKEPPQCNSDQILNPETNTCDSRCTAPDVWDPVTQQCVTEKNRCDILGQRQPVVEVDWRQSTLGSSVVGQHSCMPSGCVIIGTKDVGCLSDNDRCYGDAKYTGALCTYEEGVTSGWCSDETCSDQTPVEPLPDPDNPNPEPPSPNPDPTPGDGFTPPNPDTSADPNNPNLQEEGNKGVVNELNTANKTLENIEKTLKTTLDEITTQNKDVDKANDKLILGIQNLAKAVSGAGSSGGGGGGDGDGVGDAAVASFNCDAETFQCKGDVIQCLSAEIQFKEHCVNSELKQLEASFKKIASVDNVKAIVQEEEIDLSKIDTKYLTGSGLNVSGQCPPDYNFTVDIHTQTTVTIPLTDLCAAVQRFAPLVVLFGWISGIGLIGRQQGFY